jgi:ABC-type glycerol-3-phosphate transport system permease component
MRKDARELLPAPIRIGARVGFVLLITLPIAFMLLLSVTPDPEITSGTLIPSRWAFDNYVKMWSTVHLGRGLFNSLFICGMASAIAVLFAVGAAYVLSRFDFRGRFPYLYSLIALQSVPHVMLLLPLFVLFSSIQTTIPIRLIGTYQGPVITYLTFALPLATWLMVSYLSSIPVELEEAALVDGATRFQALRKVVVPLALPGMVVALVFSFLVGWNDVLFASVLTSPETRTLAVELQTFSAAQQGGALPLYGQMMGASVLSALPVVILYMVFQRYLIGGLTAGGVKG